MLASKIPSLGSHLMLDFSSLVSYNLTEYETVVSIFNSIISSCGETIKQISHFQYETNELSVTYYLSASEISIHTYPSSQSMTIDFHLYHEESQEKLRKAEELICDKFGWENCISSIFFGRGKSTQFFLNNDYNIGTVFKNMKFVCREKSDFQDIRVYDTEEMGRILVLDGNIQITNELEDNYTKDMVKPVVINANTVYEEILIIGAGDMIIPTYLLENFKNVKHITVVEIDQKVCEVVQKYFAFSGTVKAATETGRFSIFFEDGADFVKNAVLKGYKFDGIIIDSTDIDVENATALSLFNVPFYENLLIILKENAIFSQQITGTYFKAQFESMATQAGFRNLTFIYSDTPEYSIALPIGVGKKTV